MQWPHPRRKRSMDVFKLAGTVEGEEIYCRPRNKPAKVLINI